MSAYNLSQALLGLGEAEVRRKGEQQGSVRWHNGHYYISFRCFRADADGNLRYLPTERAIKGNWPNTARGRRAAEQAGYEQHVALANGVSKIPQSLATVEQFYETRFLLDKTPTWKKSGRLHNASMWRTHIKPTLGPIQLRDVTPLMVQHLISAKVNAGKSSQTVLHIRNCISAIFRHAQNLGFYENRLPTAGVMLPELVHEERAALTWEQVLMLADALPQYRNLIIVTVQTGMRIGEVLGLCWRDVNLKDEWVEGLPPNSLTVRSNWTKGERTTTKGKRSRIIPLTTESWVALCLHWEMAVFRAEDAPVFAGKTGRPLNPLNILKDHLKPAGRKIGLPWVTWHSLRHTTATLTDKYLTVAEKQKVLGHRTADLSNHYTHPEIERVRAAMEQMTKGPVN